MPIMPMASPTITSTRVMPRSASRKRSCFDDFMDASVDVRDPLITVHRTERDGRRRRRLPADRHGDPIPRARRLVDNDLLADVGGPRQRPLRVDGARDPAYPVEDRRVAGRRTGKGAVAPGRRLVREGLE